VSSLTTQELELTRDAWDRIAVGYDETHHGQGGAVSGRALALLGVRSGTRFLDVAAGAGGLSLPAARLGAEVLATDLSPRMIQRLAAHACAEGLDNVEARVMDGHALEFEDDTFDAAGSQFGVMLFPDLPRALREMVRVTRPGGRVLLTVLGPPAQVEFLGVFQGAVKAVVPGFKGLPADPPPPDFQVADPEKLRGRLSEAGLKDVRVEPDAYLLEVESGQQLWDWVLNSNPLAEKMIADVTEEQRAEVRQVLDRALHQRSPGSGPAVLTNPVNIGIGTK
jgi:ubiquinone/menaquinone biosynthesis C-methylase UbiE